MSIIVQPVGPAADVVRQRIEPVLVGQPYVGTAPIFRSSESWRMPTPGARIQTMIPRGGNRFSGDHGQTTLEFHSDSIGMEHALGGGPYGNTEMRPRRATSSA